MMSFSQCVGRLSKAKLLIAMVYAALALSVFLFFLPFSTGQALTIDEYRQRVLMAAWGIYPV
jgi:dolichyl-phosphate-mannose--protein O-mannosyl transferase